MGKREISEILKEKRLIDRNNNNSAVNKELISRNTKSSSTIMEDPPLTKIVMAFLTGHSPNCSKFILFLFELMLVNGLLVSSGLESILSMLIFNC